MDSLPLCPRPFSVPGVLQDRAEELLWQQVISKVADSQERRKRWREHVSNVRRYVLFNDYNFQVEQKLVQPFQNQFRRFLQENVHLWLQKDNVHRMNVRYSVFHEDLCHETHTVTSSEKEPIC